MNARPTTLASRGRGPQRLLPHPDAYAATGTGRAIYFGDAIRGWRRHPSSGSVAILVDKPAEDVDAFDTSNLREAGRRWIRIGGGHTEVDAAVRGAVL
jgi:hypothetical protein